MPSAAVHRANLGDDAGRLGHLLDCVCCDRFEMPAAGACYRRTLLFDENSMPEALRRGHATRAGVWAEIEIAEGRLRYIVLSMAVDLVPTPAATGVVLPEVEHRIEPLGRVCFRLVLYRALKSEWRDNAQSRGPVMSCAARLGAMATRSAV